MVINTKVTVEGNEQDSIDNITVVKSVGDNNATSSFNMRIDNHTGRYSSSFTLNDEVVIYADKDAAPTTVLFRGIIENIEFKGSANREDVVISGRDYGARLQDLNIDPVIYRDQETSVIVTDILQHLMIPITVNNVNVTTTTPQRITFNHANVFDSLQKLAANSDFYFYVDNDKDLHFEEKDAISSGLNIDNDIITAEFRSNDDQIYNKVWAYGGRTFTGANNRFVADGIGSTFNLDDNPHNVQVFVNDDLQGKGGIFEMDNPGIETDLKYLVDYDRKKIIFVSGAAAGIHIPASGAVVSIDYQRSKPIVTTVQSGPSIVAFGLKEKVLIDRNILTFAEIDEFAATFLARNKDPKIQGIVNVRGIVDVTPGQTLTLNIPFQNIIDQTYTILSAKYNFNKTTKDAENVLTLKLNIKVADISDTIKKLILNQKDLETEGLQGSLTTLKTLDDTSAIKHHYEVYEMSGTFYPFRFNIPGADVFDSPFAVLGPWNLGSIFIASGGNI